MRSNSLSSSSPSPSTSSILNANLKLEGEAAKTPMINCPEFSIQLELGVEAERTANEKSSASYHCRADSLKIARHTRELNVIIHS